MLDFVNTPFLSSGFRPQGFAQVSYPSLDHGEPTALYTLTRSGIHVIHDFTTDPRVLIAALHTVKGDASQIVIAPKIGGHDGNRQSRWQRGVDPGAMQNARKDSERPLVTAQAEAAKLQTMIEDSQLNFQSFEQRLAITYTLDGCNRLGRR